MNPSGANYMKVALLVLLAVAVAALVLGALTAAPAAAQEEAGSVSGVVFHDLNGDGLRDEGEAGLPNQRIELTVNGQRVDFDGTSSDGSYLIDGIGPGEYTLTAHVGVMSGICADGALFFGPFPTSYCISLLTLPWRTTTPTTIPLVVESGMNVEANFGALDGEAADVAVITGLALLEDGDAPAGTSIEALVDGQECGSTITADIYRPLNFILTILGAGERAGCATPGATVHFRVNGIQADQTFDWFPYTDDPSALGFEIQHLSAMENHALYWSELHVDEPPGGQAVVQALVGSVRCGETAGSRTGPFVTIARLIVLSESIQPGCGRPGATVAFLVDGVEMSTIPWQPGLQRIDLGAPFEAPPLGRGPSGHGGGAAATLIAALFATGLLLVGGSRLLARRR